MQFVVLCHTNRVDHSPIRQGDKYIGSRRDSIATHQMLQAVNRKDAERLVDLLNDRDSQELTDGPFTIRRSYEVAVVFYTNGKKVTLSVSDCEMIAFEFT